MNCRLVGISFQDLPHISNKTRGADGQLIKGEEVVIIREEGEAWDSDARPAYLVKLEGASLGYLPLVESLKEEALRAREGYRKAWKDGYGTLTKDQLREVARRLNESGELVSFHDWEFVGKDKTKQIANARMQEAECVEIIRDHLYTEINRNHLTPTARVTAVYYDEKEGRNLDEIGDICSLSVRFELW